MTAPHDVLETAASVLDTEARFLESRPINAPQFASWQLWYVEDGCMPPGELCLAERDGAVVIPELADGFAKLVDVESIEIADAEAAVRYIKLFIQVTKPAVFVESSLEDIAGLNKRVAATLNSDIHAPSAEPHEEGWTVTAFLVDGADLWRGDFKVKTDGHIEPQLEMMAKGISIFND